MSLEDAHAMNERLLMRAHAENAKNLALHAWFNDPKSEKTASLWREWAYCNALADGATINFASLVADAVVNAKMNEIPPPKRLGNFITRRFIWSP